MYLIPLFLFLLAAGWMIWHVAAWRAARSAEPDEGERRFQWRRFRRRVQASGMLMLVAAGMAAGMMIPQQRYPSLFVYVWSGVLLATVWVLLLALADAWATRARALVLRREHLVEHARLKAQLEQLRARHETHGP